MTSYEISHMRITQAVILYMMSAYVKLEHITKTNNNLHKKCIMSGYVKWEYVTKINN